MGMGFDNTFFKNTLDEFHIGVLVIAPNGVVVYSNKKIEEHLSLSKTQLVNKPLTTLPLTWFSTEGEVISEASNPILKVIAEKLTIQKTQVGILNANTVTKEWFYVCAEAKYNSKDELIHVVATFEEVESDVSANRNSAINDFNTILNLIPESIGKVDAENKVIYFRSKRPERLAYPPEEMVGKHLNQTLPKNLYEQVELKLNEARLSNELIKFEYEFLLFDNNSYWYETRLVPSDNGEVILIIRDISDQKMVTDNIQHEKNLFETIITSLPGTFYIFKAGGKFIKWNENLKNISGYSDEEIGQLEPLDSFEDDEKELLAQTITNILKVGHDSVEAKLLLKDGTTIPFYFSATALEYNGELCIAGVGVDMSEEVKAIEQLKTSEYRFRAFIENGSAGITVLNPDMKIIYISPGIERILGYTEQEFIEL